MRLTSKWDGRTGLMFFLLGFYLLSPRCGMPMISKRKKKCTTVSKFQHVVVTLQNKYMGMVWVFEITSAGATECGTDLWDSTAGLCHSVVN